MKTITRQIFIPADDFVMKIIWKIFLSFEMVIWKILLSFELFIKYASICAQNNVGFSHDIYILFIHSADIWNVRFRLESDA